MDAETRYKIVKTHLVAPYRNMMQEPYSDDDENNIYISFIVSDLKIDGLRKTVRRYPFCRLTEKGSFLPVGGFCKQYNVELVIKK